MSTFKEIVYLALEELKLTSDDSYYTEDHILFLLNKYRAFLLKLRYGDIRKQMPESNYLTISLPLELNASIKLIKTLRLHLTGGSFTDDYISGTNTQLYFTISTIGSNSFVLTLGEESSIDMTILRQNINTQINAQCLDFTSELIGDDILIYANDIPFDMIPTIESEYVDYIYTITPIDIEDITNVYVRSTVKVPFLMLIGSPRVFNLDYYVGDIAYISRDRMRYTGNNRFTLNFTYCSINPDSKLYFKSYNKDFLLLDQAYMTGIFLDCIEASNLLEGTASDVMDRVFPIEESLISPLIELVMKELLGVKYIPKDDDNNASDDMSNAQMKK